MSVGIVDGEARLDLPYVEDSMAEVDMNVVMTGDGRLVEVQGTAEHGTFDRAQLDAMVDLAAGGIGSWSRRSGAALEARGVKRWSLPRATPASSRAARRCSAPLAAR